MGFYLFFWGFGFNLFARTKKATARFSYIYKGLIYGSVISVENAFFSLITSIHHKIIIHSASLVSEFGAFKLDDMDFPCFYLSLDHRDAPVRECIIPELVSNIVKICVRQLAGCEIQCK
jgi:hypothetical protein